MNTESTQNQPQAIDREALLKQWIDCQGKLQTATKAYEALKSVRHNLRCAESEFDKASSYLSGENNGAIQQLRNSFCLTESQLAPLNSVVEAQAVIVSQMFELRDSIKLQAFKALQLTDDGYRFGESIAQKYAELWLNENNTEKVAVRLNIDVDSFTKEAEKILRPLMDQRQVPGTRLALQAIKHSWWFKPAREMADKIGLFPLYCTANLSEIQQISALECVSRVGDPEVRF